MAWGAASHHLLIKMVNLILLLQSNFYRTRLISAGIEDFISLLKINCYAVYVFNN